MASQTVRISRLTKLFAAAIFSAVCSGCTSVPGDTESRDESFSEAAQYQRKPEKVMLPWAISDRGREIEKDFGVSR